MKSVSFFFVDSTMTTDTLPIDSLMIDRWTNQWTKQLGFTNDQLLKRNSKVEQFARVCDLSLEIIP